MKLRRMLAGLLSFAMIATSSSLVNIVYAGEGDATQVIEDAEVQSLSEDAEVQGQSEDAEVQEQSEDAEVQDQSEDAEVQDQSEDADEQSLSEESEDAAEEPVDTEADSEPSEELMSNEASEDEDDENIELASTNVDNYSVYGSKWVPYDSLFDKYEIENQIEVPAAADVGNLRPASGMYACFFLPYNKDSITSLDSKYDNYSIEIKGPDGSVLDKLLFKDIDEDYILNRVVYANRDMTADRDLSGYGVPRVADSIKIGTNDDQSENRPYVEQAKYFYYIDLGEYISAIGDYAFRVNIEGGMHSDWRYYKVSSVGNELTTPQGLRWRENEGSRFNGKVYWDNVSGASGYIVKLYKKKDVNNSPEQTNQKVFDEDTLIKAVKTTNNSAFLIRDYGNLTSEEALGYYYTVRAASTDPTTAPYSQAAKSGNLAERLTAPTGATWKKNGANTSTAHWKWKKEKEIDPSIKEFSVTLFKNGERVTTKVVSQNETNNAININGDEADYSVSFEEELKGISPTSANYTFTVTALSDNDNRPFVASSESVESTGSWKGESLGTIGWNPSVASIVEFNVRADGEYTLTLYKDNKSIYTKSLGKLYKRDDPYYYDLKEYMETAGQYYVRVTEKTDKTFKEDTTLYAIGNKPNLDDFITFPYDSVNKRYTINIESIDEDQSKAFRGETDNTNLGEFDVMIEKSRFRVQANNSNQAVITQQELEKYCVLSGASSVKSIKIRALSKDTSSYLHSKWKTFNLNVDASKVSINTTGKLTDTIKYSITGNKGNVNLVITGNGDMLDYFNPDVPTPGDKKVTPWASFGSQIKSITIDDRITKIGDYAFYNLTGISAIKMPSALTTIGDYSFYGCKGLKTVEFPKNVSSIGKSAFGNTTALSKVVFTGDAPKIIYKLRDDNGKIDADASFYQNTTLYYSTRQSYGWTSKITKVNNVRYWNDYKIAETVIPLEKVTVKYANKGTSVYRDSNVDIYTSIGPAQLNIKAFSDPEDASNKNVTWKSSNTSVAKILSSSGNTAVIEITGKVGYSTITAVSKYSSKITDTLVIASYDSNDKNVTKNEGGYWVKSGSNYYYMDAGTKKVLTGWQEVPTYNDWSKWNSSKNSSKISETGTDGLEKLSEWHYFNRKTGARMTGWLTEYEKDENGNQILYYLDPSTGSLTYGNKKISGKWYHFNDPASDDPAPTVTPQDCNDKSQGGPSSKSIENIIGCAQIGWVKNSGIKYKYYNKNGQALTGWNEIGEDKWYYFDGNGIIQTGWTKVGSNWYYFGNNPAADTYGIKQYGDDDTVTYKGMRTYAVLDLYDENTDNNGPITDKTVSGCVNMFLMTGKNFDNKNEVNNSKLVSGWDGNNEKYYNPTTFQLQTGFVKIGSSYYYFRTVKDATNESNLDKKILGKKIKYEGSLTSGFVDYYLKGNVMTEVEDIRSISGDSTPIYRFNKNGVLTKTYKKGDYALVDPTINQNTANGEVQLNDKYYYIKSGNFATGFVDVATPEADVLSPTKSNPDATKKQKITHTWYFSPTDTYAKRGIQHIGDKYYLFDQAYHQVKDKAYYRDNGVWKPYPANVFVNIANLKDETINAYDKSGYDLTKTDVKPNEGVDASSGLYKKDNTNAVSESYTYWFKGGVLATGWYKNVYTDQNTNKKVTDYFYFDPTPGDNYGRKLSKGWHNISGSWYEFDAEGKAVLHTAVEDGTMTATITPMEVDNSAAKGGDSGKTYHQLTDASGKAKGWTRNETVSGKIKALNPVDGFYKITYGDTIYDGTEVAGGIAVTYLTKGVVASGFKTIKCASNKTVAANVTKSRKFYFDPSSGEMQSGFEKIGGKYYYFYTGNEKLGEPNSDKAILNNGDYVKGELAGNVWIAIKGGTTYVIPAVANPGRPNANGNDKKYDTDIYRNGPVDAVLEDANTKLYYINSDGTLKTGWLTLSYKARYTREYKDPITNEEPKTLDITIKEMVYFDPSNPPEKIDSEPPATSYGQMLRSQIVDNRNYYVDKYGIRQ